MHELDLTFALRLAEAADAIAAPHVGTAVDASTKSDGSPVSAIDEAIEATLAAAVERDRPRDGYLGEEVGNALPGRRRWIVDGIDGSAAFVAGRAEWATLIGHEVDGVVVLGVASAPALQRRWWASRGNGAWTAPTASDGVAPQRLAVSELQTMGDARVEAWLPSYRSAPDRRAAIERLARVCRCGGDLPWATPRPPDQRPSWGSGHPGGAMLVAAGLLDGFVMFGSGPWDHAATAVIVEEAGGRYSDLTGGRSLDGGGAVFSNGILHDAILAALRG